MQRIPDEMETHGAPIQPAACMPGTKQGMDGISSLQSWRDEETRAADTMEDVSGAEVTSVGMLTSPEEPNPPDPKEPEMTLVM